MVSQIATPDPVAMQFIPSGISDDELRGILLDFLTRMRFKSHHRSTPLEDKVIELFFDTVGSWDLGLSPKQNLKHAAVGLLIGTMAYRHTPIDVQIAVSIFTYLGTMCDDDILSNDILREFAPRFFDGMPQLHPILDYLIDHLANMRSLFPRYTANSITVNTVEFINAEMFVRDEGGVRIGKEEATQYLDFMRWKNGVGEAFVYFIWPKSMFPQPQTYIQAVPYAVQFICLCNDLLSFYKEEKAGETENYVSLYASAQQKSAAQVLRDLVSRMVEQDRCIKCLLGDTPEWKAWEDHVSGYIEFHILSSRYRLQEILPEFCFGFDDRRSVAAVACCSG